MTYVSSSGAYVRKRASANPEAFRAAGLGGTTVEEELWNLLETPHTVESLERATTSTPQPDRKHIERVIERLLDADLIELSPDS